MARIVETFSDLFAAAVAYAPGSVALRDVGGSLSYEELDRWSNRGATALAGLGVTRGDRVAIVLPNCREFLFLWFGSAKIGAVHVAINARLRGEALLYQITHCQPACLVIDSDVLADLDETQRARLPSVPTLVRDSADARGSAHMASLQDALDGASSEEPGRRKLGASDPLVIMYTSGTTGAPKGVVVPHYAYVRAANDLVDAMALTEDDRMYVCLPLYHGNPQVMAVTPTLRAHGTIALSPRFSASAFWNEVVGFDATAFTHIGGVVSILVSQPVRESEADNPLRVALGGAPRAAGEEFGRRFGCTMLDGWGMIEAGCNTTVTPISHARPLGQHGVARGCFDVRVVDATDDPLGPGEVGEIVVRPTEPHVMFQGYFNAPERTLEKLTNLWFHSGDRGLLHPDGSLEFLGRDEDAVRRNGENVPVDLIEHELASMEGVSEVAVVGVPDEIAGQELVACVVAAPGFELDEASVGKFVVDRLGRSMQLGYVRLCDSLPKTASEKVQRFELRALGIDGAVDVRPRRAQATVSTVE